MDQCEGKGVLSFPNNALFEGNFIQNHPYGKGTFKLNNQLLSGYWEFHGKTDYENLEYTFRGELVDLESGKKTPVNDRVILKSETGMVSFNSSTLLSSRRNYESSVLSQI